MSKHTPKPQGGKIIGVGTIGASVNAASGQSGTAAHRSACIITPQRTTDMDQTD